MSQHDDIEFDLLGGEDETTRLLNEESLQLNELLLEERRKAKASLQRLINLDPKPAPNLESGIKQLIDALQEINPQAFSADPNQTEEADEEYFKTLNITQKKTALEDLSLGNRSLRAMLRTIEATSSPEPPSEDNSQNKAKSQPKISAGLRHELRDLEYTLKKKGPRWAKVLGAAMIIGGIILSVASFLAMYPTFGTSSPGIHVGVTWTLTGVGLFFSLSGAAIEYGASDSPTPASTAIDRVSTAVKPRG